MDKIVFYLRQFWAKISKVRFSLGIYTIVTGLAFFHENLDAGNSLGHAHLDNFLNSKSSSWTFLIFSFFKNYLIYENNEGMSSN